MKVSNSEAHRASAKGVARLLLRALVAFWMMGFVMCGLAHAQPRQGSLAGTLGANHIDLLTQYLGTASSGDGSPAAQLVTHAMGIKALQDAANYSFSFFRVAVSGYNPALVTQANNPAQNDLYLWQTNPSAYWAVVDQMFADLDAHGIKIVAVLNFNWTQFPALTNETFADLIKNPNSASRNLFKTYISQFIKRYKNRQTILFYELSNELNLGADVDNLASCLSNAGTNTSVCSQTGNFTSADLLSYSYDIVKFVKSLDANHQISSGFSLPRPYAFHLAQQPEWSAQGADWTTDSPSQFAYFLNYMNRPFDITSVHIYAGDVRFGRLPGTEWETLDDVVTAARRAGKRVYLGEFADNVNNGVSPFITTMTQRLVQQHVDYASPWVFEFYQFATYLSANYQSSDPTSLEPGITDAILQNYGKASTKPSMQLEMAAALAQTNSNNIPQVVLTWPWPCASANGSVTAYAVASSPDGIQRVDFAVDGVKVASSSQAPFAANIPLTSTDLTTISATAYSFSGLSASYSTQLIANGSNASCHVPAVSYGASASTQSGGSRAVVQAESMAAKKSTAATSTSVALTFSHVNNAVTSADPAGTRPATIPPAAPAAFAKTDSAPSTIAANTSAAPTIANSGDVPHLLITVGSEGQIVTAYAAVSSSVGTQRVSFAVNGITVASVTQAPFAASLTLPSIAATTITATVYATSGTTTVFSTQILDSDPKPLQLQL